ncbi:MAG: ATP-binding protein [Acidimicrobiales bacterium]
MRSSPSWQRGSPSWHRPLLVRTEPATTRPSGTVAFLFTDVEGSTVLWDAHPDAMRSALETHDRIVRHAIETNGGHVFSTAGDAFCAAFSTPAEATRAALDAQHALHATEWPAEAPVKVRMALHVGAAQERDGDYFGPTLNRAARLMGLAHGGQILLSQAMERILRDEPSAGFILSDLGQHALRGLVRPEQVFQLSAAGLPADFPPLRADTAVSGNLPVPPTSFVGRTAEVQRIATELGRHRVVTLVGPGGVGKTRLSIEAASTVAPDYPDGVWFIELAPVVAERAIIHAVTEALKVSPVQGVSPVDSIVDAFADRHALIVLDNCEHVIDSAAELVRRLVDGTTRLTILATSRELLRVLGEQAWPVPPLNHAVDAVELFVDRASAVIPGFEPTPAERDLVASLCAQLDGIPLAIELAAARISHLTVVQLVERLSDRFRLLRSSARSGLSDRQLTLRGTVEWSYRLLEDHERLLFDRVSVFAGTFDLAAAEVVCGGDRIDSLDVVDLLSTLVEKSLVLHDHHSPGGRYRLLDTLRQFGAEQLDERDEAATGRDRHLRYYAGLAGRARSWFEGSENQRGRAVFEVEWDNLRAALNHAERSGDLASANGIVRDSFWCAYWGARAEHTSWSRRLADSGKADSEVLAAAAAWAIVPFNDHVASERYATAAIANAPTSSAALAIAWWARFLHHWSIGNIDEALEAERAAKTAAFACDDPFTAGFVTSLVNTKLRSDPAAAMRIVEAARSRVAHLHNDTLDSLHVFFEGLAAFAGGETTRALRRLEEAVDLSERAGNPMSGKFALVHLAIRSVAHESAGRSAALLRSTMTWYAEQHSQLFLLVAMTGTSAWASRNGHNADAARILGFLDRHDPGGWQTIADVRPELNPFVGTLGGAGPLLAEGAAMTRDQMVAYCLDLLRGGGDRSGERHAVREPDADLDAG